MIKLSFLVTDKTACSLTSFENKRVEITKSSIEALTKALESDMLDVAFEVEDANIAAALSKLLGTEIEPVECVTCFEDFQTVFIVTAATDAEELEVLCCSISSIS